LIEREAPIFQKFPKRHPFSNLIFFNFFLKNSSSFFAGARLSAHNSRHLAHPTHSPQKRGDGPRPTFRRSTEPVSRFWWTRCLERSRSPTRLLIATAAGTLAGAAAAPRHLVLLQRSASSFVTQIPVSLDRSRQFQFSPNDTFEQRLLNDSNPFSRATPCLQPCNFLTSYSSFAAGARPNRLLGMFRPPNAFGAPPRPPQPPPWQWQQPPQPPPAVSFWQRDNVRDHVRKLQETIEVSTAL
jgi:hypothetical protein